MALTKRQQRFVDEYLIDFNGKKAAIRAGYSAATAEVQASKLLRVVKVRDAISAAQKGLAVQAEKHGITAERVLAELAKIAFADIRNVVTWRTDGVAMVEDEETGEQRMVSKNEVTLVNSSELTAETAASIGEVSQSANGTLKVKLHDKHAALVDLGRHLGLFVPGRVGDPALGKKELANRAADTAGDGTDWGADLQVPKMPLN